MNRHSITPLAMMAVPEAPMDEDNLLQPRENQIGLAGEVVSKESEAKAEVMNYRADNFFWGGVLRLHRTHRVASSPGGYPSAFYFDLQAGICLDLFDD